MKETRLFNRMLCIMAAMYFAFSASAQEKNGGNGLLRFAKKITSFIDTMAVNGIDPNYISTPQKPWQVIAKSVVNQSDMKMKSTIDGSKYFEDVPGEINWSPRILTTPSTAVGLWAGYRGYGIGYTKHVGGDDGFYFVLTAMGGRYGANVRFHNFKTNRPKVHFSGYMPEWVDFNKELDLGSPIRVNSVIADAYYMFNGKQFSYSAAYDQSAFQLRSAGSFIVGATYYHSSVNYASDDNADFILFMGDTGKAQQWQASLGIGYAYNYVPSRNWLISIMAMPTVSFVNKMKGYKYDSKLKELILGDIIYDIDLDEYMEIWPTGTTTHNGNIHLNADVRLSISYNFDPFFACAYGTFNRFSYKNGSNSGSFQSWYVNSSIGIRF